MVTLKNIPDGENMREMKELFLAYTKQELSKTRIQNTITFEDGSGDKVEN